MKEHHRDRKERRPGRKGLSMWTIAGGGLVAAIVLTGSWFLFSPDNLDLKFKQIISKIDTVPEKLKPAQKPEPLFPQDTHPLPTESLGQAADTLHGEDAAPPDAVEQEPKMSAKEGKSPAAAVDNEEKVADQVKGTGQVKEQNEEQNEEQTETQHQCKRMADKLHPFFDRLDREEYIKEFQLDKPVLEHFQDLTEKLYANPPVVTRESDDLYTILTNMAHFFRIIGQHNILLIKGILDRESDEIEDIALNLYNLTSNPPCDDETLVLKAPLAQVYEYAGFFLNTMGGRSYLFRRESRSRLLVNYYAILIIDQTNQQNLNPYGLDISPMIPKLIREIEATNQLIYKEDYLDRLMALEEAYPVNN